MLTTPEAPSFPPELRRALDAEGEEEYRQLLRVTRAARGGFFLFLIESDYSPAVRDMLLDCLRADLGGEGLRLRRVTLTAEELDLFRLPELETPVALDEAIVLVGIENTPGLVREPGSKPERPPIYALLNRLRETLHTRLPVPFLVWCTPSVYTGLQTHAPDFFDHYAGLFQFMDASPNLPPKRLLTASSVDLSLPTIFTSPVAARSAAFYEQQSARYQEPTPERARALLGLAEALLQLYGPDYPQHVQRSLDIVKDALALLSPERDAPEWARGQRIQGVAYRNLPIVDQTQNLPKAIACFEAALRVYTETDFPLEWARVQNHLGVAYRYLPTGDRTKHLLKAIACHNAALRVFTETDFPLEWARVQNNLGFAYSELPASDRTQNLQQAIACYTAATRVFTETDFAYYWARTQINLGNAYSDLPTGERGANLRQAIACYEAALRVYTEAAFPLEWARTQNNMGIVYWKLAADGRMQTLWCAVDCYEAALRVRTEANFPQEWAITQLNLALVQEALGNQDTVRLALHCAGKGFRQVGLEAEAERAENLLRELGAG